MLFSHHKPFTIILAVALLVVTITCTGCSTLSSAEPWHRIELEQEFAATMVRPNAATPYTWDNYLQQEEKLFQELKADLGNVNTAGSYRYAANSPLNPMHHATQWNRSFILRPEKIRAGIVMLHGLTDSPYSVRSLAQGFYHQGFLVIAVRLPGHGTIPSSLMDVKWQDWVAATRLAVEEMQRQLGNKRDFYLLGYSNGGTLALNYALDAATDKTLPQPKKVILLSPMIGISKFAGLSESLELIGQLPLLSSRRWLSKSPEYNPFKYNSFPVNAAWQAHRFSRHLQHKIQRLAKQPQLQQLAPVLAFQSTMDATVKTAALEKYFFRHLPQNGSELVLFDINRHQDFIAITDPGASRFMSLYFPPALRNYNLVRIANQNSSSMAVSEWRQTAGGLEEQEHPLPYAFPQGVYSLSHVALPFPTDDPVYGLTPRKNEFYGIELGRLHFLGELNTLIINANTGMRLYSNPFYPYMEQRIFAWIDTP